MSPKSVRGRAQILTLSQICSSGKQTGDLQIPPYESNEFASHFPRGMILLRVKLLTHFCALV